MSTKPIKVPAMGALLVGAAMAGLIAGSATPAQAGAANASLGATSTTAADVAGVPINASLAGRYCHRCRRHCRYGCRRWCRRV
jgi:hypothetical protein